jgi:GMP synthase (glutamine-hydrolysing)
MQPILILQHLNADGPGYFGLWLQRHGVPFEVRNTERGDPYPQTMSRHAALAVLGGEMGANDPLPSLRQAEALILDAMAQGKPVIGHCLGGQLMARALGARVQSSPEPEVGWQSIAVTDSPAARQWFGDRVQATVFEWHYDAFELPPGALHLAGNAACPNQAFATGPHLAMQFHIEVDVDKVTRWSLEEGQRWAQARAAHAHVHDGAQLREGLVRHLPAHQALADQLYAQWMQAVA